MKFSHKIYLVLSVIPFVCLLFFVAKYKVDVPHWDQWELVPLLGKACEGSLTVGDIWQPHNEHRTFFPMMIMITLARFSNWNIVYELVVNVLIGIGIFSVIIYQLRKTDGHFDGQRAYWLIPIISLIVFSLPQSENWLWGWQMQMLLNILAVTAGIVLLANYADRWPHFIFALLMGVIAAYSFSNGTVYWVVGLLILPFAKHADRKTRILKLILWVCGLLIISYTYWPLFVHKSHRLTDHTPLAFVIQQPLAFAKYVLAYLGNPICSYRTKVAIISGILGLIVSGLSIWILLRSRNIKLQVLLPYIGMGLYVLGSAVLTGIGRAGLGVRQAISSRYVTVSNLFWISNIMFLYILASTTNISSKSKNITKRSVTGMMITIIVLFMIVNSVKAMKDFKFYHAWLTPARSELLSATNDVLLSRLYPNIQVVKTGRAVLEKYKLSVFRERRR